jgi:TonB family protein
MSARDSGRWPALSVSFLLAFLLQLPLLGLLWFQSSGSALVPVPPPKDALVTEIVPRPQKKKEEPRDEPIDGQVIELPTPEVEKRPPEETKFLAKHDTTVEKQTKARVRVHDPQARGGRTRVKQPSPVQTKDSQSPEETRIPEKTEVAPPPQPTEKLQPSDKGQMTPKSELFSNERTPLLLPSTSQDNAIANIQALSGIASSDDAILDDIEEAEEDALNAKSFRYWDFFNRVKEKVRENWTPADVYRQHDPNGRVYGVKDRLTVLHVTLDADGKVLKVTTAKPSGVEFLDNEAVRAMRAAAPFVNPPVGLVDETGVIAFKFGFLFEISGSRQRFFWKRL